MDRNSPSEAVFGAFAWLTTRDIPVIFGSAFDAAPAAQLAEQFCRHQGYNPPRNDYTDHMIAMPQPVIEGDADQQRDAALVKWQAAKAALEAAKDFEMEARKAAFALTFVDAKEGTNTVELGGGYEAKGVRKVNYKLDRDIDKVESALEKLEKLGDDGKFIAERLVKWTAELSLTEYKKLDPKHRKIIDTVVTTTDGAPTLEIKEPKAKR